MRKVTEAQFRNELNEMVVKAEGKPPVALQRVVRVQWIKECAQCGSLVAIALGCAGLWQVALGMVFWAWVTYFDARASTHSNDQALRHARTPEQKGNDEK